MKLKCLVLVCGLLLLSASPSWATKYWIDPAGSDANACASIDGDVDPGVYKKTALNAWTNCMTGGDTLHYKAGTWTGTDGQLNSPPLRNGTSGAPTIIEGEGSSTTNIGNWIYFGSSVTQWMIVQDLRMTFFAPGNLTSTNIIFRRNKIVGPGGNDCIISGANFFTVQYNELSNCGSVGTNQYHGMYLQGTDNVVEYNYIHDNIGIGYDIQCYRSVTQGSDRCTIRYNRLTGGTNNGIVINGNDDVVYRNIITGKALDAIKCGYSVGSSTCARAAIDHNVIYNNTGQGIVVGRFGGGTSSNVRNNIVLVNSTGITCESGGSPVACGTISVTTSTNKTAGTITDCTPSTSDFTQKSGSSCIDAGTAITGYNYNGSAPDQGAFETFVFSACAVANATASVINVTFTNNLSPPLLPSTGVTTFTARKATVNDVVTGVIRTGDNQLDITVTDAFVAGNAIDISWASGNLTDSALIGNSLNQPYVQGLTNQSCTNNVGGAPSHLFIQAKFEFHGLRGTEAAPIVLPYSAAAENTNINVVVGGKARLRVALTCTTADCPPTGFYLYYSKDGGAYAVVPDSFGADNIAFCGTTADPDIPTSGTPTTDQLSTAGTFVAAALVRTSNAIPTIDLAQNNKTEPEYCVAWDTDTTADATYDFRIYKQDATAIDTYTVTPRATVRAISAGLGF